MRLALPSPAVHPLGMIRRVYMTVQMPRTPLPGPWRPEGCYTCRERFAPGVMAVIETDGNGDEGSRYWWRHEGCVLPSEAEERAVLESATEPEAPAAPVPEPRRLEATG